MGRGARPKHGGVGGPGGTWLPFALDLAGRRRWWAGLPASALSSRHGAPIPEVGVREERPPLSRPRRHLGGGVAWAVRAELGEGPGLEDNLGVVSVWVIFTAQEAMRSPAGAGEGPGAVGARSLGRWLSACLPPPDPAPQQPPADSPRWGPGPWVGRWLMSSPSLEPRDLHRKLIKTMRSGVECQPPPNTGCCVTADAPGLHPKMPGRPATGQPVDRASLTAHRSALPIAIAGG